MLRKLPVFIRTPVCTFETLFWKSPSCFSPFFFFLQMKFSLSIESPWKIFLHSVFRKIHLLKYQKMTSTYLYTVAMTPSVISKGV